MSLTVCRVCQKKKGIQACDLCGEGVCRACSEVQPQDAFSFLEVVPVALTHRLYCGPCFDTAVAPARQSYESNMRAAKAIFVFWSTKGEQTRFYSRTEKPYRITDCVDREETLLRLAFYAARDGFNALIDVQVTPRKLRQGAYQTTRWNGVGTPTHVDADKLNAEDAAEQAIYRP